MSGPWIPGKEKDCITAEGNFQKDEYESNEILDNSYFTRKTRSMAMLEGLVPLILPVIQPLVHIFGTVKDFLIKIGKLGTDALIITDGPDWMRQFLHPLAFKYRIKLNQFFHRFTGSFSPDKILSAQP